MDTPQKAPILVKSCIVHSPWFSPWSQKSRSRSNVSNIVFVQWSDMVSPRSPASSISLNNNRYLSLPHSRWDTEGGDTYGECRCMPCEISTTMVPSLSFLSSRTRLVSWQLTGFSDTGYDNRKIDIFDISRPIDKRNATLITIIMTSLPCVTHYWPFVWAVGRAIYLTKG